jgi:antitoxin VbhA-like protein
MREPVKIVGATDRLFRQGIRLMSQIPKDTRSAAEKSRDTAGIIGSLKHEGYVPNAEDLAIHQQAERGEITSEEASAIFRERPPAARSWIAQWKLSAWTTMWLSTLALVPDRPIAIAAGDVSTHVPSWKGRPRETAARR